MRKALQLSAYRRLLVAYALNQLAWTFGSIALALLVYRRTGSALGSTAFFLCTQFVPALIAPLVVSRLDQRPVRRVLPAVYLVEAAAFGILVWLIGRFALVPVLAVVLIDGAAAVTARSLARAATVAVLTPSGLLREGNALTNLVFSACYMIGPVLAGVIVAAGGTRAALLLNCALFGLMALGLATTGSLPAGPAQAGVSTGRLRAGLAYAREHLAVRSLLILQLVVNVSFTIAIPVEVVFAEHTIRAGSRGYGLLLTAWGVGTVVGSVAFARSSARSLKAMIGGGAVLTAAGFVVMALAPGLGVALAGAGMCGAGNGVEAVAARTALQEATASSWMGLVMGLYESLLAASPGVGILLGGAIATLTSARAAFVVAAAGGAVATLSVWRLLGSGRSDVGHETSVRPGPSATASG